MYPTKAPMTDGFIKPKKGLKPITITEMIRLAPDLFCASRQFLLIEPALGEILK